MVRLGMLTRAPNELSSTMKRMPMERTTPVWPLMLTISPMSTRFEKISVRPVTTSCTTPCEPKPTARPITEALAR